MISTTLINSLVASKDKMEAGNFQVTGGDSGTYVTSITHQADGTIDRHTVYTDIAGLTSTVDTVFTVQSAQSVTSQTSQTNFNGVASSAARSFMLNADGTIYVDAHLSSGSEIIGTITNYRGGSQLSGTITTAAGAIGSVFDTTSHGGGSFDTVEQVQLLGQPAHTYEMSGT